MSKRPVRVNMTAPNFSPVQKTLAREEGQQAYLEWKGATPLPPLHFAHANGFNGMTYRHLLAPLADRFHIRAWDARGHGATSLTADPATQKSWYRYADDLIVLLEQFAEEAGSPILLAGHSMGGATSIIAAAKRPDLVRGIVLLDPVMIRRHHGRLLRLMTQVGLRMGPQDLASGAEKRRSVFPDRQTMVDSYRGRGIFRTWPDEYLVDYVDGGTRVLPSGEVELACAPAWEAANFRGHDHDIFASLEKLKVPLSLIYAGIGSTCRGNTPFLIGEQDKRANLLRIGTGTHFLPVEYPDLVQREILALHQRILKLEEKPAV